MATILVVDDEPDIRLLTKMNLERDGHTIVTAIDGEEALDSVRDGAPDLIVLDVMMPNVDGWDVLEQLKSTLDKRTTEIPVILLTALESPIDRVKGGIEGAVHYLTKPMDIDALRTAVSEVLAEPEPSQRRKAQQQALEMLARIERNAPANEEAAAPRPRLSALEHERDATWEPQQAAAPFDQGRIATLTDKQRRLLRVVSTEPTVMQAASELGTSRSNVYASLHRISRNLGTGSVRELLKLVRSGDVMI